VWVFVSVKTWTALPVVIIHVCPVLLACSGCWLCLL